MSLIFEFISSCEKSRFFPSEWQVANIVFFKESLHDFEMSDPVTPIVDLKCQSNVKAIKSLLTIVILTSVCILGFSSR